MSLPYNRKLTAAAKKLRNDMTEEEKKLWYQYLSGYPIRFLRQKVIENCILDFYCAKCRLAIEVDGGQHHTDRGIGHDDARTKLLKAYGVTVIRFDNRLVRDEFGHVCRQIDEMAHKLLDQKAEPSQLQHHDSYNGNETTC